MGMAVAADGQTKRRLNPMAKRKKRGGWLKFLPVVIGVLVTPLALRSASMLALSGPTALAALFPWTQLVRGPLLSISAAAAGPVGQYLMYLQFPIYGLVMFWIMRKRAFGVALLIVLFFHVGCVIAASGGGYVRNMHLG